MVLINLSRVRRIGKSGDSPLQSTRPCWRCRRCGASATACMSKRLPSSRAWSAGGIQRMLTTCALRNHGRSVARSAMSSLFHYAGDTIVRFITAVMKQLGGIGQASTRLSVHGHCGSKHIHCLQARPKLTTVIREPCGIKITKRSQIRRQHPMASLKQIEANRRNAMKSTGPKTEAGKEQSRHNAVRHGLTAETVVNVLEDPEDYKAFEIAVASDFDV